MRLAASRPGRIRSDPTRLRQMRGSRSSILTCSKQSLKVSGCLVAQKKLAACKRPNKALSVVLHIATMGLNARDPGRPRTRLS